MNECMSWKKFEDACQIIARYHKGKKISNVYGIPRGGLIIAVRLSHLLGIPLILKQEDIDSCTLIVDDTCDTGKTLKPFMKTKFTQTATLYRKTTSPISPSFWVFPKTDKWIVFPWEK